MSAQKLITTGYLCSTDDGTSKAIPRTTEATLLSNHDSYTTTVVPYP